MNINEALKLNDKGLTELQKTNPDLHAAVTAYLNGRKLNGVDLAKMTVKKSAAQVVQNTSSVPVPIGTKVKVAKGFRYNVITPKSLESTLANVPDSDGWILIDLKTGKELKETASACEKFPFPAGKDQAWSTFRVIDGEMSVTSCTGIIDWTAEEDGVGESRSGTAYEYKSGAQRSSVISLALATKIAKDGGVYTFGKEGPNKTLVADFVSK